MRFRTKRIYDRSDSADGQRVLVDRLWPRGVSKTAASIDYWAKAVAPSTQLRRWYGHDPAKWKEFRRRYFAELAANPAGLADLRQHLGKGTVTLLYGSREEHLNDATALREYLEQSLKEASVRKTAKRSKRSSESSGVDSRFVPVIAAFARDRSVTHGGKGFGSTGLKVSGKLFAFVSSKGQFVVKVAQSRVAELVAAGNAEPFDPGHGRRMKEWAAIGSDSIDWIALAKEAREFVKAQGTS